jgi:surface polysaccharide O-acyltransferase-like enzyme
MHRITNSYYYNENMISMLSPAQQIFAFVLHIFGRCGVPLFMYLTGYLVLTKKFETTEDINRFYKTHLCPLIAVSTGWGVLYYFYGIIVFKRDFSIIRLILEVLTFNNYEGSQFWYIPCILGLYLFIPFVSMVLNKVDKRLACILFFSIIYLSAPATINPILNAIGSKFTLEANMDLSWSGGQYGLLVLIGYFFAKIERNRLTKKWIAIVGIGSFLFALWEESFCFTHKYAYDIWYNNLAIIALSAAIFALMLSIQQPYFREYLNGLV